MKLRRLSVALLLVALAAGSGQDGKIANWNDPALTTANRGATLPAPIAAREAAAIALIQ